MQHFEEASFSPLEYDLVADYTSSLFDNYMEYKQLVKAVQVIMTNPGNYNRTNDVDAILPEDTETLVDARNVFRGEMNKIVQAVDLLSKDPRILKSSKKLAAVPANSKIRALVDKYSKKATAAAQSSSLNKDPSDQTIAKVDASEHSKALEQDDSSTVISQATRIVAPIVGEEQQNAILPMASSSVAVVSDVQADSPQAQGSEVSEIQNLPVWHDQWVWLDYDQKNSEGKGAESDGIRPAGYYLAWVGTDPKLLDTSRLPDELTEDGGEKKMVYVPIFENPIPANAANRGELTKARVPDVSTDKDTHATADQRKIGAKADVKQHDTTPKADTTDQTGRRDTTKRASTADTTSDGKVTQPARKLATEDRSSTEVSKPAIPTVAERETGLDFDMMVRICQIKA